MKRIKLIILGLITLIFPLNVYALTGGLTLSCPADNFKPGDTVSCTVSAHADEAIGGFETRVSFSNKNITINSFKAQNDSLWYRFGVKNDNVTIHGIVEGFIDDRSFTVGTLTFKLPNDITDGTVEVKIDNVSFSDSNYNDITSGLTGDTANVNVKNVAPVTEKGLKILLCSAGGILSPQLSDSNKGYSIILNGPSTKTFAISASAKNDDDDIKFVNADTGESLDSGNIVFKPNAEGVMGIKISVGSGDSLVEYIITVTKPVSERGTLSSLIVGGKKVNLQNNKYDYQITLDNVSSYEIQATVNNSDKFKIESAYLSRKLSGEGTYEITVKPIDETAGYGAGIYIVSVGKTGSSPTKPPASKTPTQNPQTGEKGLVLMALTLIVSLMASIYLYKKNIDGYNN